MTASAKTVQESKKNAKEKIKSLPYSEYGLILKQKITLGDYLTNWLEREILATPKSNSPWVTLMLWWFFPFIMLPRQIFKYMRLNKEIDRKNGLQE